MADILLTHGYFLCDDEKEQQIMKPYPPLELLSLSAYLKSRGFAVDVYDSRSAARRNCWRDCASPRAGSSAYAMQWGVTVEPVRRSTALLKKHGIQVGMFLMWGFEGEEIEDIAATVEHVKRAAPDIFFTTVSYPIKGTPYFDSVNGKVALPLAWRDADRDFYRLADQWLRKRSRGAPHLRK